MERCRKCDTGRVPHGKGLRAFYCRCLGVCDYCYGHLFEPPRRPARPLPGWWRLHYRSYPRLDGENRRTGDDDPPEAGAGVGAMLPKKPIEPQITVIVTTDEHR